MDAATVVLLAIVAVIVTAIALHLICLLYTSPSPRDRG